jgi:putative FmdB family regulatory protein
MPTYEYLCKTCSHRFETWQKMTDDPLTICPECGATIRRVLFPAGIVFKGSGFYKTDHPVGAVPHEAQETKVASSETGSTSESKESKPAESGTNGTSPASTTTGDSSGGKAPASVA